MLITENLFASVSTWRRNVLAQAFIGGDEETIFLLSAMNITPCGVEPITLDRGENNEAAGWGDEEGEVALQICTSCCSRSRLMLTSDWVRLLQFLRSRSCASTSVAKCMEGETVGANIQSVASAGAATCEVSENIIEKLMSELHSPSCWWRLGEVARHALSSPSLSWTNSSLIRHRCSAVSLKTLSTAASGSCDTVGTSSTALSNSALGNLAGSDTSPNNLPQGNKLLLPRGTPPSFIRENMLQRVMKWLRSLITNQASALSSTTPEGLLCTLFGMKKKRSLEADSSGNNRSDENPETRNGNIDLVPHVSLLITLFGYTVTEVPSSGAAGRCSGASEGIEASKGVGEDVEESLLAALGVDIFCRFCGGRPPVVYSTLNGNESGKGVQNVDSMSCDNNEGESGRVRTQCTIRWSERAEHSGHHESCPWRELFLTSVLKDDAAKACSTDLIFTVGATNSTVVLLMCFKLHEVVNLMECWRVSVYTEFKLGETYAKNPFPVALRSALPPPAEPIVEDFLQKLQSSRRCGEGTHGSSEEGRTVTSSGCLGQHQVPLFGGNSFWNSYFRVSSFVNAAASGAGSDPAELQATGSTAAPRTCRATVGPASAVNGQRNKDWKAAYDAGRRYILASAEAEADSQSAVECTLEELQKFTDLYRQNFQRDAEAAPELLYPPAIGAAMDQLWQQFSAECSSNALLHRENVTPPQRASQLSAEDRARVHSLLDSLERSTQNAARERAAQAPQSLQKVSAKESPQAPVAAVSQQQPRQTQEIQQSTQGVSVMQNQPKQPWHQPWKQRHTQKNETTTSMPTPRKPAVPSEGILPIPVGEGGGGAVLSHPAPAVLQLPQPQPPFPITQQGFPPFAARGRESVLTGDSGGVLDDNYSQRTPLMGQRRGGTSRYGIDRIGGGRGSDSRRGRRGTGRGAGRGGSGVVFK